MDCFSRLSWAEVTRLSTLTARVSVRGSTAQAVPAMSAVRAAFPARSSSAVLWATRRGVAPAARTTSAAAWVVTLTTVVPVAAS